MSAMAMRKKNRLWFEVLQGGGGKKKGNRAIARCRKHGGEGFFMGEGERSSRAADFRAFKGGEEAVEPCASNAWGRKVFRTGQHHLGQ